MKWNVTVDRILRFPSGSVWCAASATMDQVLPQFSAAIPEQSCLRGLLVILLAIESAVALFQLLDE